MCVIVHVGAKRSIAYKQLEKCYNVNPDGWGIMWAKNGKLQIVKEKSDFKEFKKIWHDVPMDVERAIHFRIKTHGEINKANCHPFQPREDIAFMHNGIIDTPIIDAKMSDTFNFSEYELKAIMAKWPDVLDSAAFKKLMQEGTGYSKLLFMDNTGKVLKIRENVWAERNGCFFSNTNSLDYSYTSSRSTSFVRAGGDYNGGNYGAGGGYRPPELWKPQPTGRNYTELRSAAAKIAAIDENTKQFPSDLYSGNKTDEEGRKYHEDIEEDRILALAAQGLNHDGTPMSEPDEIDEDEEDFTSFIPSVEDIMNWDETDIMDWMMDYPKAALIFMTGVLGAVFQAEAVDDANAKIGGELSKYVAKAS